MHVFIFVCSYEVYLYLKEGAIFIIKFYFYYTLSNIHECRENPHALLPRLQQASPGQYFIRSPPRVLRDCLKTGPAIIAFRSYTVNCESLKE